MSKTSSQDDHFPDPKWRAYMNNKMRVEHQPVLTPQNRKPTIQTPYLKEVRLDVYRVLYTCSLLLIAEIRRSPVEGTVVYPIIYRDWNTSQVVSRISSINSMSHRMPMFFWPREHLCSSEQDLYVLRRLADVVQPLIRRFTADETVGKPNKKRGIQTSGYTINGCFWLVGSIPQKAIYKWYISGI